MIGPKGTILITSKGPDDWKDCLAKPDLHWKAGHSAMETALAWEGAKGELPKEIAVMFPKAWLIQAIVEYRVDLPGGNRPSFTDVFALVGDKNGQIAVMVEGKREEAFGPKLSEWRTDASDGKQERLSYLCDILGFDPDTLDGDLRYQLLHRTASAILTAKHYGLNRAAMVVQSFDPAHSSFDDFALFASLLNCSVQPNGVYDAGTPSDIALQIGWASAPLRSPSY